MYVRGQEETQHIKYQERSMQKDFLKVFWKRKPRKWKRFSHLLFLIDSLITPNFYLNAIDVSTKII